MGVSPKAPAAYRLTELTPGDFEVLTFLLARDAFPEVVHVRQKDFGLDVRLPSSSGGTSRGWQAKHFPKKIHWNQCQDSVRRALAFWRPLHITFVFPKVLSGKEQNEFRTALIEEFPLIKLDWWDASELQPRLRDSESGRRAAGWLFPDPEAHDKEVRRLLAVSGELSDAAHAAARIAEVQKFISRDPHLRYEKDAPAPPHADETIISMEAEVEGMRVRFEGSERYPGAAADAGLGGKLIFSDDEEGNRAREAFEHVARNGGTVEISSGMTADFGPVPVGLRGLMPEEPVSGSFQISAADRPQPPSTPVIPVLMRAGETEIGIALAPTDPPDGWQGAVAGSAGGMEVVMALHGTDAPTESRVDWRWRPGEGTALEQLLTARIVLAAYQGATVQLVTPHDDQVVVTATMDLPEDAAEQIRDLKQICSFLGYVAEAETGLGATLEPPAQPTRADLEVLSQLVSRLRNPKAQGTFQRVELVLSQPPAFGEGPFAVLVEQQLYAPLFGEERYIGRERIHLPAGRIENYRGTEATGDTVAIVPHQSPGKVEIYYYPPTAAPQGAPQTDK